MIPENFGPRLKLLRRKKHLTQSDISKILNITRQAYSNYETGRCSPPVDTLAELTLLLEYDFFSMYLEAVASKYLYSKFHSNYLLSESEEPLCQTTQTLQPDSSTPDSHPATPKKKLPTWLESPVPDTGI